jgi:hypothetical protein
MTVSELKKLCEEIEADGEGNHLVLLSSDAEGNAIRPLASNMPYNSGRYDKRREYHDDGKHNAVCFYPE